MPNKNFVYYWKLLKKRLIMASGDPQRIWFAEMIEDLKTFWNTSTSWEELTIFCRQMSEKRKQIRKARNILPPRMWCPSCKKMTHSVIENISIRSALFILKKIGIISDAEFKDLDKNWMKYKKKNNLDENGNKVNSLHSNPDSVHHYIPGNIKSYN